MRSLLKKIARIPLIANIRRSRRIWLDAKREATVWTPQDSLMLAFYRQFLGPNDVCFDVGANVGNRLKIFRKIGAKVIAIEPQHECAKSMRKWYADDPNVTIIEKALSDSAGTAELMISNFHMISSLSKEWVEATQESGRFAAHRWKPAGTVALMTMDELIDQFGLPRFAKIDVEGFELKVVRGLTQPIPFLSLEFTPETRQSSIDCLQWLTNLGAPVFNFSEAESMSLRFTEWIDFSAMQALLASLGDDYSVWGDIYISFPCVH